MTNYFVLQKNDQSVAYAFKISFDGYKPEGKKNQREQFTVTGTLDVQVGPNENVRNYAVKLTGESSGNFSVTAGSIMTAGTVTWGTYDNLVTLFESVIPPSNKFRFRDISGVEYWAFFTGSMRPTLLTPQPSGADTYQIVAITLRVSA
jgi:hypothetical protein